VTQQGSSNLVEGSPVESIMLLQSMPLVVPCLLGYGRLDLCDAILAAVKIETVNCEDGTGVSNVGSFWDILYTMV
jgi:hypothetical protein